MTADKQADAKMRLIFHWGYIALPLTILILTVGLTGYFYRLLPAEVAYHFQADGSPDRWLNRGTIILWTLLLQFLFTLVAWAITWGITRLATMFSQPEITWIRPGKIMALMGNMVALPQIILCFAMLDIFSYNSYQIRLIPLWVFVLIIMVAGGIVLGVFFIQIIRQAWLAKS